MITLIAAIAENNALGYQNNLLWHLPDDLKNFKLLTQHNVVIMGRKTYESIGKPLPNRINIVISSTLSSNDEDLKIVKNMTEAIALAKEYHTEIFIIGGGKIYKESLPLADKLHLTLIHATPNNADTFFPEIDFTHWELISETFHKKDEKHSVSFSYRTYKRIKNIA